MICGLVCAGELRGEPRYLQAARETAERLWEWICDGLRRCYGRRKADLPRHRESRGWPTVCAAPRSTRWSALPWRYRDCGAGTRWEKPTPKFKLEVILGHSLVHQMHYLILAISLLMLPVLSPAALIAHYSFDGVLTDSGTSGGTASLGSAATLASGNAALGSGYLSLSAAPAGDTSGNDGALSANSFT